MNVLSLFDGMSCGHIALDRLGVKVNQYFASEIDKYAIQVTQKNYPDTIQLGDVTKLKGKDLPKIDLLIAGSPCQGFPFAGKQLNFNDPRSALFFEFVRLKEEINPKYFLLENVNMKKEYLRIISEYLGIFPVRINSNLVSAQNRDRWYWSNIRTKNIGLFSELWTDIPQPEDRGIFLKDVLEDVVDDKYFVKSESKLKFITDEWRLNKKYTQINGEKAITQQARQYASWGGDYIIVPEATKDGFVSVKPGECFDFENPKSKTRRGRKMENKSNCLMTKKTDFMLYTKEGRIRRLTPVECERLQTVNDNYTDCVSDNQRYKMLGNGWTVEVIKHILSFLNGFEKTIVGRQKNI